MQNVNLMCWQQLCPNIEYVNVIHRDSHMVMQISALGCVNVFHICIHNIIIMNIMKINNMTSSCRVNCRSAHIIG